MNILAKPLAVEIVFESHATTIDNESGTASGHFDVELSELGIRQAKELGDRYQGQSFAAIFCSDLQRSYVTADLAFGDRFDIVRDERLRECDYGLMTRSNGSLIQREKPMRILSPFPGGESYQETVERMGSFLSDLSARYEGERVMIIGHRATQYGLEYWIRGRPLEDIVVEPWAWQPGWVYLLGEFRGD